MTEQTDNLDCRTRSLPVIELGFKVKDTKELVLRARVDLAAIERTSSEASLRRMGDIEYQLRLQEQDQGEPTYEPHDTRDMLGAMALPPVIPREQPRDNSDNREQRSPRTQISKEDKKAQEQEERITQSILGSRIEPPSETPRETVAQLEFDISDKYRHVVKANQEPQIQRVRDRVKHKKGSDQNKC